MANSPIDDELQQIKSLALHLRMELHALTSRIDLLEQQRRAVSEIDAVPSTRPEPIAAPAPTPVEMPLPPTSPGAPAVAPAVSPEKAAAVESLFKSINRQRPPTKADELFGEAPASGLEERIGKIWLNRIGAIVLLLGVAFFVKYSFDQGWISPTLRVSMGGAFGLLLIGIGEYSLRTGKRPFAVGLLGAGVVVLYFSAFAAYSFYHLISTQAAFALLSSVTVISSLIAVHARMLPIAIMGIVGGFWTPVALSTGVNQQVALMTYLLILDAGFLVVGSVRRWDALRLLCWVGSAVLFEGWFQEFYAADALHPSLWFLLAFYLLFHAEAIASLRFNRTGNLWILPFLIHANNTAFFAAAYFIARDTHLDPWLGSLCVVIASVQILIGWRLIGGGIVVNRCRESLYLDAAAMLSLAAPIQFDRYLVPLSWSAQAAATLFFCRWNARAWWRLKAVGILAAAFAHLILYDFGEPVLTKSIMTVGRWNLNWITVLFVGWGLFAYLGAASLTLRRAWQAVDGKLAGVLVLAGSAAMLGIWAHQYERYLSTWWWLGLALCWLLMSKPMPLASLVYCLLAVAAAGKFLAWDTAAAVQSGSWSEISGIILNRAVLTGLLVCIAMTLAVRRFRGYMDRLPNDSAVWQFLSPDELVPVLVVLAALVFTWTGTFEIARIFTFEPWGTHFEAPRLMASAVVTAFWAINAAGMWLVLGRRRAVIAGYTLILCFIATLKFAFADTAGAATTDRWQYLHGLCNNRVFVAGLVVIAAWFVCAALFRARSPGHALPVQRAKLFHGMLVWGAILTVWLPTFEIMRGFRFEPFRERFADPTLAMHVALSVFWSVSAVVLLAIGFARRIAPLRYLAITLFAMTIIKVFVVDLANLETVYRIVSFIVLGVLLLAASFLYQQLSARILVNRPADA